MKPITKKILTASICLMAGGAVLTGIGFAFGGRPGVSFTKSGITSQSTRPTPSKLEKTKINAFTEAEIKIDSYADIHILASEDDNYYLEYLLDADYGTPEYDISDNIFTMTQPDKKHGMYLAFTTIGNFSLDTYINLYIPEDEIIDYMYMYNESGDISIRDASLSNADFTLEYGDIILEDSRFDSLVLDIESGDSDISNTEIHSFNLTNAYGENTLKNVKCKTVDVTLDSSDFYMDAAEIDSFDCYSEYGNITLLLPENLETYSFDAYTEYGYLNLPSDAPHGFHKTPDDEEYYETHGTGSKSIKVYVESGDIEIRKR